MPELRIIHLIAQQRRRRLLCFPYFPPASIWPRRCITTDRYLDLLRRVRNTPQIPTPGRPLHTRYVHTPLSTPPRLAIHLPRRRRLRPAHQVTVPPTSPSAASRCPTSHFGSPAMRDPTYPCQVSGSASGQEPGWCGDERGGARRGCGLGFVGAPRTLCFAGWRHGSAAARMLPRSPTIGSMNPSTGVDSSTGRNSEITTAAGFDSRWRKESVRPAVSFRLRRARARAFGRPLSVFPLSMLSFPVTGRGYGNMMVLKKRWSW
ncbi:hypothetical protein HDK90DRAFT_10671 [Phyllosticta capitalensis]|uniref:Uncharacterized protein n=1 Tax=Phyllosticta capitalensis TaxID=121624 RepID=A0ABR1Z345_9PEZI